MSEPMSVPILSDVDARIEEISFWPLDLVLTDPFAISAGSVSTAKNLFVSLSLRCGLRGYGEIAPFTEITGETRNESLSVAQQLADLLIGQSLLHYRQLSGLMAEAAPQQPA